MKAAHGLLFALLYSSHVFADGNLTCANQPFDEKTLLLQAPSGAKRISRHVLEVKYSGGMKKFIDKPPHEELSGKHWSYCGYNEKAKVHLLGLKKDSLFSGKILFENSGKILSAGHTLIVSPDNQKFLSIEQEDGMDGEIWTLSEMSGRKLWSGYAGVTVRIPGNNYDSVYAQFEKPYFSDNLTVVAHAVCFNSSKRMAVTLSLIDSKWIWTPEINC